MFRFILLFTFVTFVTVVSQSGYAEAASSGGAEILRRADEKSTQPPVSPIRRIQRDRHGTNNEDTGSPQNRSYNGSNNNRLDTDVGAKDTSLQRWTTASYEDDISQLAGANRNSPRQISNTVSAQAGNIPNQQNATDFLWQWGQFLDHDIDLTDGVEPAEAANIAIPIGDTYFDPDGTGVEVMSFNRSIYDTATGTDPFNPRQQLNEVSSWIDASNVYGSDSERAHALRVNDGSGKLKTSPGNLLPYNVMGLANAGGDSAELFIAGDVRANEQAALTAMHTLFVREHNRLADEISGMNSQLSGTEIYQRARRLVGAQMQVITYREYLPLLLGHHSIPPYHGYNEELNASISNVFAHGVYRYGHSALSSTLLRLDANGQEIVEGHLGLRDAFFSPDRIALEGGIEPLLRGLAAQVCQRVDVYIIDDVRNFLFGDPGDGGFDLASLNIQRGRDHGLSAYNDVRSAFGLPRATSFLDVSSDPAIQGNLASAYVDVDSVDVWVGALAEDHLQGAMVGELAYKVIREQFIALRDGDRYWYANVLSPPEIQFVENTRLSDIIRRNTTIGNEIQDNVFRTSMLMDADNDGVLDVEDNCTVHSNPGQEDTDGDGIGNQCDTDIGQPNDCTVNFQDLAVLGSAFLGTPESDNWNSDADFNSDDVVNFADVVLLRSRFLQTPGPSSLPNACMGGT